MPTICGNCNTCVERINQHLNHVHQIGRGTTKMPKKKKKKEIVRNLPESLKLISQKLRHSLRKNSAKRRNQIKIKATKRKHFQKKRKN